MDVFNTSPAGNDWIREYLLLFTSQPLKKVCSLQYERVQYEM